jgi:leader peptidase (prepilin peptidase)/N-methyltransferase
MLRGRAKCCGTEIPFRFFTLELLTGICLPLLFLTRQNATEVVAHAILISYLLVASCIDIDTLEIPDHLTISLAILGMLGSAIFPEIHGSTDMFGAMERSVLGLLGGTGILFWIGVLGEQIFKKEAIGFGDIKLIGAIGTFCGIGGTLWAIFGGAIAGTFVAIPLLFKRYVNKSNIAVIPFAPFLSIGTVLFIFFGKFAFL